MHSLDYLLFQLLPHIHTSHYHALVIHFLSSLQIIHLVLRTMSFTATPQQFILSSLVKNIRFLTAAFEINPLSGYNTLIDTFWAISANYLTGFILLSFFVFFKLFWQKRIDIRLLKVIANLYIIHARVLFFPIQFLFSAIISLENNDHKIGWLILTIIFSLLNFGLVFVKEFLLYKCTQTSGDSYAAKNNLYHQLAFLYKGVMLTLFYFNQDEVIGMRVGAFFHVIMCLGLIWTLYKKLPFYDLGLFQYIVISSTTFLSLAIISIIQVFASSKVKILGCVDILLLLLPVFAVKIALSTFKQIFENILKGDFKSPEYAIHFAVLLELQPQLLKSNAFLPHDCSLSGAFKEDSSVYNNIAKKLEEALLRYPQSDLLFIFTMEFYLTKLSNLPKFLELFKRISLKGKLPIHTRVTIEGFYRKISDLYMADKPAQHLDLLVYFKHSEYAKRIRCKILAELDAHIHFWKDIKQGNLDIKKTVDRSLHIDSLSHRLEKLFTQNYKDLKIHFPQVLLMYSIYLSDVRYFGIEGRKLFSKFQQILSNQIQSAADKTTNNPSKSTVVAILSLDKKTPGQILNISGPVYDLFRFNKNYLLGNNFGMLFPAPIAKTYQQQIQQYANLPAYKLDHNYTTYAQSSQGDIFEVEAHFQLFVYGNNEITVALTLQKKSKSQLVCIVGSDGQVVSLSKSLKEKFPSDTKSPQSFMFALYSDFSNVNSAFNMIYGFQQNQQVFTLMDEKATNLDKIPPSEHQASTTQRDCVPDTTRAFLATASPTLMEDHSHEISRHTSRFTLMAQEKAQTLHDQFIRGKYVTLAQYTDYLCSLKDQVRARMQVKPLVFDKEVYKIIIFKNLTKESKTTGELTSPVDFVSTSLAGSSPGLVPEKGNLTKRLTSLPPEKDSPINIRPPPIDTSRKPIRPQDSDDGTHINEEEEDNNPSSLIKIKEPSDKQSTKENTKRDARIIKTLQEISRRTNAHPALSSSIIAVYLAILVIIALNATDYKITRSSIYQVSKGINLLNLSADRLFAIINTWQDGLYLYLEAKNPGFLGSTLLSYFTTDMETSTLRLASLNNQLKLDILDLNSNEFLAEAYTQDILIWNSLGAGRFDMMNSFTATDLLVNKYVSIATTDINLLAKVTSFPFTLNNTANSYMFECLELNDQTEDLVQNINNNKSKMTLIIVLETSSLVLFCVSLVGVALVIKSGFQRLFRVLSALQQDSISVQLGHLQHVQTLFQLDIETKSFIQAGLNHFYEGDDKPKLQNPQAKKPHKTSRGRSYTSRNLNIYLIKIVLSASFSILIIGSLFFWSLFSSLSSFDQLGEIKNQVSIFCKMTFQTYLFLNVFNTQVIARGNPSFTVLNEPPSQVFTDHIDEFLALNDQISRTFLVKSNPSIDSFTLNAMTKDACILLDGAMKANCQGYLAEAGDSGLFAVGMRYLDLSKYYIDQLEANSDPAYALNLSLNFGSAVDSLALILQNGYPALNNHALNTLADRVKEAKKSQAQISTVNFVFIFIYSIFLYLVPFRKLKELDLSRRRILKIIPYPVVQENKILSYYLIRDFSKEVGGVKSLF